MYKPQPLVCLGHNLLYFVKLYILLWPAKRAKLVSAINSFGSARATGDANLIAFAANMIGSLLDTLEFSPEEEAKTEDSIEE
jgi:hypothetical protein